MENNRSEAINELVGALAKAQGAFGPVFKSRINPRFGSRYATLDDIISATRQALSANGLAVMQLTDKGEMGPCIITVLAHSSGQWLSTSLPVMVGNITSQAGKEVLPQAQAFGSALTYARRYALAALLNLAAEEDDDAETSGRKGLAQPQHKAEATAPQDAPSAPQTPDVTKKGTTQDEKVATTRGNCPVHGIPFVHRTGITKSGARAGKPYDFWSCPEKLKDGTYCQEKPQDLAQEFEGLWDEQQPAPQPVAPGRQEAPKTPSVEKTPGPPLDEAPRAIVGRDEAAKKGAERVTGESPSFTHPDSVRPSLREAITRLAPLLGRPVPDFEKMTNPEAAELHNKLVKVKQEKDREGGDAA